MNEINELTAIYTEAIIDEDMSAEQTIDEGLETVGCTQEITVEQADRLLAVAEAFEAGTLDPSTVEVRVREIFSTCGYCGK